MGKGENKYLTICVFILLSFSIYFNLNSNVSSVRYTENGRVHGEAFIEWPFTLNFVTYTLPVGSIFHLNFSVLPISFSNVSFEYLPELGHENRTIYTPKPPNIILNPYESFAETYTIVNGTAENYAALLYKARPLIENSNATVHWWFEVLEYGKVSLPGVLYSFGVITLLTSVFIIRSKKKKIN